MASLEQVRLAGVTNNVTPVFTVPGDRWIKVIWIVTKFTTDATPGTYTPFLQYEDANGVTLINVASINGQQPNQTFNYGWFTDLASAYASAAGGWQQTPLPDLLIPSGWRIRVVPWSIPTGFTLGPTDMLYVSIPTGSSSDNSVTKLTRPFLLT